jgi:hypothetical protein
MMLFPGVIRPNMDGQKHQTKAPDQEPVPYQWNSLKPSTPKL